jgi:hypothetical protein
VPLRWVQAEVPWDAAAVGPREGSLELVYQRSSCGGRNQRMTLRETRSSVTVHITDEVAVYPPGRPISCPGPELVPITAQLAHRLRGRVILGRARGVLMGPRGVFGFSGYESEPVRVPNLIGFAPRDARYALDLGYLRASIQLVGGRGGRQRVVSQRPSPRRLLARGSVVLARASDR